MAGDNNPMDSIRLTTNDVEPGAAGRAAGGHRWQVLWGKIRRSLPLYLLLLPGFGLLLLFTYYPTLIAVVESFFDWKPGIRNDFIGWNNYIRVLTDPIFWQSWWNVSLWAIWQFTVPFIIPILVAEGIFNLRSRMTKDIFRVAILIPILVPGIVTTLLWKWIYSSPDGGLNLILKAVGLAELARPWLGIKDTALPALMFMGFPWVVGTAPLIYLAGLMNINQDVIDSSMLDGCPTWRRIISIDLPHIIPQIRLFTVFGVIGVLQNLGGPLALTQGGPSNATMVPGLYLYNKAFGIERFEKAYTRLGEALAVGVIIFIIIFILTYLANRFLRAAGTEFEA
jgi:raffinose/stachyose/melibiose transport system permease protein